MLKLSSLKHQSNGKAVFFVHISLQGLLVFLLGHDAVYYAPREPPERAAGAIWWLSCYRRSISGTGVTRRTLVSEIPRDGPCVIGSGVAVVVHHHIHAPIGV